MLGRLLCWFRGPRWEPDTQPVIPKHLRAAALPVIVAGIVAGPWRCSRCGVSWDAHK